MSATDAAYRLAHRYPGGVVALAARMGLNANTLQHKLNPNSPGHHFYLADAELATALTGDAEIAQALALACGHVCVPVMPYTSLAGVELASRVAKLGAEFGDMMRATLDAVADNRVTSRELAEYDDQFNDFLAAAVALRADLAKMIPRHPDHLKVAK